MIQINISGLMEAVKKASPFIMPEMNDGTNYLYNNVYSSMANDEPVSLSDLDFSAFESDDIQTLTRLYNDVFERNNQQANNIACTLRNAAPVCKAAAYI